MVDVELKSSDNFDVTTFPTNSTEDLLIQRDGSQSKSRFEYDRVFNMNSNQIEVFQSIQPLIVSVLDGYNVCIFAYGQTGEYLFELN